MRTKSLRLGEAVGALPPEPPRARICRAHIVLSRTPRSGLRFSLPSRSTSPNRFASRRHSQSAPDDVTRHLGLNLRVYIAIECRHPFAEDRNVFLNYAGDFHFRTRNGGRRVRLTTSHG